MLKEEMKRQQDMRRLPHYSYKRKTTSRYTLTLSTATTSRYTLTLSTAPYPYTLCQTFSPTLPRLPTLTHTLSLSPPLHCLLTPTLYYTTLHSIQHSYQPILTVALLSL